MKLSETIVGKTYTRVFVYILVFNIIFAFGAIVLHEAGHLYTGIFIEECTSGKIILFDTEADGPYTELDCPPTANIVLLRLSSFFLLVPIGLIFFLLKEFPERYFLVVILGFSIYLSAIDMSRIANSAIIEYISIIIGLGIYFLGEYLVAQKTLIRFREKLYITTLRERHNYKGVDIKW
ncbi:hypothetical protein ACFLQN_00620 [Candidatus Aenigmatarchaeota archaeon]